MPATQPTSPSPDAVREAAETAAKYAAAAEADRRLPTEVVTPILAAGFARHFVPARWGGSAGTFRALLPAVAAIGESCTSAAWFASLAASVGRLAAHLPVDGQAEIWRDGPDTPLVGALAAAGTAERVPGGWRVSGQWPYVSGIDSSAWALVCARAADGERREPRFLAVPRASYAIGDSWFNVGLRATGSNTLVLDGVTVPDARSVALADLLAGKAPAAEAPCHRVPMKAANGLTLAAPLLGAARGALHHWSGLSRDKLRAPAAAVTGAADRSPYELTLARADGEIDTAALLLDRVAEVVDGGAVDPVLTARNGRDCALAAELLANAVDRLLRSSGSRGQSDTEPLQRFWRDVNAGAGHSGLQFPPVASALARASGALDTTP
ncbi:acyl-CoA dehydrogenase family protein [Streptomyces sp. NPDC006482]|uniref:acyl-CoA dehydrogenase family protein n=1 Tax=Streptomyces sp. NPDC006482 TaxID=3154306 RepID=UPI0033A8059D